MNKKKTYGTEDDCKADSSSRQHPAEIWVRATSE